MADLVTPQLKIPFQVVGETTAPCIEQDSADDIEQNVVTVLRYNRGDRPGQPEFGIPDQALRQNGLDEKAVVSAVLRWVPEAKIDVIKDTINQIGEENVTIEVKTNRASEGQANG